MERKTAKFFPSTPLKISNQDLEQRLEMKSNDVKSCNTSINFSLEEISYFKVKDHETQKRSKNYETLNKKLKSVDSIYIIAAALTFDFYKFV